ncbi:MAG: putative zinc-binding protein [Deltaproteobacteria bacterium]|nr:putative zinc-binding protein [Deltaproteobacteria bacterium]
MSNSSKIVYSCSGCSSAAQMANDIAVKLDREKIAEMSCIAGVGGNVPSLVRKAKKASHIIAIDGCPLHCVVQCLKAHHLEPTIHFDLSALGVKKELHEDYCLNEFEEAYDHCVSEVESNL